MFENDISRKLPRLAKKLKLIKNIKIEHNINLINELRKLITKESIIRYIKLSLIVTDNIEDEINWYRFDKITPTCLIYYNDDYYALVANMLVYDDMDSLGNPIDRFRVEFKIPVEILLKISEYIDSKIYDVLENEYKEYLNTVKQNWINNRKIEFGLRSEKYYES